MFWKRKKELVLNCYTNRADVYNFFPVVEAKRKVPEWFKKIPTPVFKHLEDYSLELVNLKQCVGFLDYYKKGFILPLWSDLVLNIGAKNTLDYRWQYSDRTSSIEEHHPKQTNNHFDPLLYQHLKLISPWLFSCDEDISFLAVEPGWQFDMLGNARVLSGVIGFKYQTSANINIFFPREEKETEVLLAAGMPLYHLIPLTERKITIKTHLVSDEHFNRISQINATIKFMRHYEKREKLLSTSGCPFQHELSTRD